MDISEFASQLIDAYYGEDYGEDDDDDDGGDDSNNGAPVFAAATAAAADSYPSWRLQPQ